MIFKYRVKGKVNSAFILRGLHFEIDSLLDMYIRENELEFLKERVAVSELIDLSEKAVETPVPMLEQETENKPKEIINELQTKRANNVNKGKHKENL